MLRSLMNWLTVISLCNIKKDKVSTSYTIWALKMSLTTGRWRSHKPGVNPNLLLGDIRGPEWYVAEVLTPQITCSQPHGSHQLPTRVAIHVAITAGWEALCCDQYEFSLQSGTHKLRRPSLSSRRSTDLKQSSAAYHICSVTSCLLLLLEDILLQTLLHIITVVVPAKWHCHLWTR